jgi:hypothetical protein
MAKLIDELKKENTAIVNTLDAVKTLGINSKEGKEKLLAAKTAFLEHLKKEDKKLYPILRKAAKNNDELKTKLDEFGKDMDKVSNIALYFFNSYSHGGSGFEFKFACERFCSILKARMLNILIISKVTRYPGGIYEKLY